MFDDGPSLVHIYAVIAVDSNLPETCNPPRWNLLVPRPERLRQPLHGLLDNVKAAQDCILNLGALGEFGLSGLGLPDDERLCANL